MKITISAILENISTRTDGTVKLTIGSQEIDSTEAGNLFVLRNKYIKVLLSDNNISPMEETLIDELKLKDGKKVKTKSQRLRSVLYRIWEHEDADVDFNAWYDEEMEIIISHFKKKLD